MPIKTHLLSEAAFLSIPRPLSVVSPVLDEALVHKLRGAALHELVQILPEQVSVLLHHPPYLVHHLPRVVADAELQQVELDSDVEGVVLVGRVQLLCQGAVLSVGQVALLVHQTHHAQSLLDEVQTLAVVLPLNLRPWDALLAVLVLLQREDVLVEVLLQLLVGVVNVELLEVVLSEALEPEYIQHANGQHLMQYNSYATVECTGYLSLLLGLL